MTLYFITGSEGKFREVESIIPGIKRVNLDLPEIQELDSKRVIEEKLKEALKQQEGEFFCEDTSIHINTLNGFPGPLIKWVLKAIKDKGLAELVSKYPDRTATARTLIGYTNGKDMKYFEGVLHGQIVYPRGTGGFGWDQIFQPNGFERTLGEMTLEEKNKISMRKQAVVQLKDYLDKL